MTYSKTPVLDELTHRVNRLHGLLADPQPGLFTWNEFVLYHWQAIVNLWSKEEDSNAKRTK